MNFNSTDISTSNRTLIEREADDESWEQLRREFNTLFSNLATESKTEDDPTNVECEPVKKPIVLRDHDDPFSLKNRKNATSTRATYDACIKQVPTPRDIKKSNIKGIDQAIFIFNTLEGKEACMKIFQHILGLFSLLLWRVNIKVPTFSSKLRSVILQLSVCRYILRFGNFGIILYRFIKRFRRNREIRNPHFQRRSIFFYLNMFQFRSITEGLYNLTDELILFHKLNSIFSKGNIFHTSASKLMKCIKQQHNILWGILNIVATNKLIVQWQKLTKDDIYLGLFNFSDKAKEHHKLEYKLLISNKIDLKLQKNIVTLDFYKITLNLLSNLINIKGKRKEFNSNLAYEIITVSSGITELIKLWKQAGLTLEKRESKRSLQADR